MTEPVERDAHRIVAPDAGLTRFDLVRHDPSPSVARFVDRHRIVTWGQMWPGVERVTRIELAFSAWEADVLPLNYTRTGTARFLVRNPGRVPFHEFGMVSGVTTVEPNTDRFALPLARPG